MTTVDNEAPPAQEQKLSARRDEAHSVSDFERGVSVRTVVGLTLIAGLFARGLAPALPGLAVGMEGAILIAGRVAAVLSLLAVAGALAASARLTARVFADARLDTAYRLLAAPASVCVGVLAVASVFQTLNHDLSLVMAFAATAPVLVAVRVTLRRPETRAAGLVLALSGGAALLHVLGRAVALHATEEASVAGFRLAQSAETLATLVDLATLGVVATYLVPRIPRRARVPLAVCALLALGLVLAAGRGAEPESAWWQVLPGRILDQLLRRPDPFLPRLLRYAIEVVGLFLAALALGAGGTARHVGTLFAACLAGRGAADIPILAVTLLLAGLLAPDLLDRRLEKAPAGSSGKPSSR